MPLTEIVGQPRALELLQGALARGQVHHAYLFGGPEGSGKEAAARAFMQALNCEVAPGAGCGACGSCVRVAANSHADMAWVMPEQELVDRKLAGRADFPDTPSREVKIAQVRALMERLALKPLEAKRKVAVILRADRMNPQAQNALLKTLEEPPPETTIILVSAAPDSLLPTIRSRCLRVPFVPLAFALVAEQVAARRKLPREQAELCVRLAQGSLTGALKLDAERLAQRKALFASVSALSRDDARPALALAEQFAERPEAEWALGMLELWVRDQLVLLSGGDRASVANGDLTAELERACASASAPRLLARLESVKQAEAAISRRNGSPRMQLERVFLEYSR